RVEPTLDWRAWTPAGFVPTRMRMPTTSAVLRVRRDVAGRDGIPRTGRLHVCELVRFVEDIDLEAALDRLQDHALADLADVVDAPLRGGVHLDDVERCAVRDCNAGVAGLVRVRRGAGGDGAVQRLRQDSRHRGLPGASRTREEIGLANLVVLDRVAKRPDDRLLADHLVEPLRPVLPVESAHVPDSSRCG